MLTHPYYSQMNLFKKNKKASEQEVITQTPEETNAGMDESADTASVPDEAVASEQVTAQPGQSAEYAAASAEEASETSSGEMTMATQGTDIGASSSESVESEGDMIRDNLIDPVSPDEVEADEDTGPRIIEYIVDEDDETEIKNRPPKEKPNIFKYIVIAIVLIGIVIGAVMMLRTHLLQTQLDLGREYLEEEKYDEATNTFHQALKIFRNSADAYLGLAQASIGRGELTEALAILEEGIDVTGSSNLEKSRENIIDQVFATYVLNEYLINILPGENFQLEVTNRSEDMDFTVEWSSDDSSVGTVDQNGYVIAKRNGKATIAATVGNEIWGYRDITATLVVGVIVTYLEEAGCHYVEDATALTAPCFVYQLDKEGYRIYDGTLEIEQGDATYSLTKCTVSDPDVDGNVTYDIEYTVTVPTRFGIVAGSKESKYAWYYNWVSSELILCDDYTGLVFAVQDLYGSDDVIYDSTVNWNGVDYHITGTTENEWENNEEWAITFSPVTQITWAEAPVIGTYRLKIKVPKEYQGLSLALDKKGVTDYTDPVYDVDEDGNVDTDYEFDATKTYVDTYFFDPQEDGTVRNAEDIEIIRLADFATPK